MGRVVTTSAPPTTPAKHAAVFRNRLTHGSRRVSTRRLVSVESCMAAIDACSAPQAVAILAQSLRRARSLAMPYYSTTGSSVARNAQPLCCTSVVGEIAVAHNGNLVNTGALRERLQSTGVEFSTTN